MKLDKDMFVVFDEGFSGKELVLLAEGLFLLYKSSTKIYQKMEGEEGYQSKMLRASSM